MKSSGTPKWAITFATAHGDATVAGIVLRTRTLHAGFETVGITQTLVASAADPTPPFHPIDNCHCWSPPTSLFLVVSRLLLEDAQEVFSKRNRFVIIPSAGCDYPTTHTPDRLEASVFLTDVVRAPPRSPLSQIPRTGLSRPLNTTTSAPTSLRTKTGSGPSTTSSSTSPSQPSPSASTWPIISRPDEEEEEEEEDSAPLLPYSAPA